MVDSIAEWRPVKSLNSEYEITRDGKVRRAFFAKRRFGPPPGKELGFLTNGYPSFYSMINGKRNTNYVHRLVAEEFLGPAPEGTVVNHKNGNKCDNRPENLEYISQADNVRHAFRIGLVRIYGSQNHRAKLNEEQVEQILLRVRDGCQQSQLAKEFGVHPSVISDIMRGKKWKHVYARIVQGGISE